MTRFLKILCNNSLSDVLDETERIETGLSVRIYSHLVIEQVKFQIGGSILGL